MTRAEFLKALKKTPRTWRLYPDAGEAWIRDPGDRCPIEAVAGIGPHRVCSATFKLRLSNELSRRLVLAADARDSKQRYSRPLRRALLRACGLAK